MNMTRIKLILLGSIFIAFCSCKSTTKKDNNQQSNQTVVSANEMPDSIAITNTLHEFFNWYDANVERLGKIKFVTDSAEHLTLNENNLKTYLNEIKNSGLVSDLLLEDELKFYSACAKIWKTQDQSEIPEGLQADRFYCAQDYIAPYSSGKVTATIIEDKANATLSLRGKQNETKDLLFELKKENGKWLLSKLGCNFGIVY